MIPAGAFLNRVVLIPCRKLSWSKFDTAPLVMAWPKYGSQRSPTFKVTRSVVLHASCAKTPRYHWLIWRVFGAPCSRVDACPVRKSARPRPVIEPLKLNVPLVCAKSDESDFQYDT